MVYGSCSKVDGATAVCGALTILKPTIGLVGGGTPIYLCEVVEFVLRCQSLQASNISTNSLNILLDFSLALTTQISHFYKNTFSKAKPLILRSLDRIGS